MAREEINESSESTDDSDEHHEHRDFARRKGEQDNCGHSDRASDQPSRDQDYLVRLGE